MAFRLLPTDGVRRPKRVPDMARSVGFLTLLLGILTLRTGAAPLDAELGRLSTLEIRRNQLLTSADSLGHVLSTLPPGDRGAARLLGDAETLGEKARDLDLEILLVRERCRSLAQQELASLGSADSLGAVRRRDALRTLLDGELSISLKGELVLVEPDSTDGYETLLDKQAYLSDLRDRIVALETRSGERIERISRERALLRESEGFAEESRFLDEGGRVGPGAFHVQTGAPPYDGPGHPQAGHSFVGTGREDQPLTAAPSESTAIGTDIGALRATRARLHAELARVDSLLQRTSAFLDRFVYPSR